MVGYRLTVYNVNIGTKRKVKNVKLRTIILAVTSIAVALSMWFATPAHANTPLEQLANNNSPSSMLCANRQGGGTAEGTPVIGYNCGDSNNFFTWNQYDTACGNGVVTYDSNTQTGCPFGNGAIDFILQGDPIASFYSVDTGLCMGNPTSSGGGTVLTGCGDNAGNGRGWGTMNVLILSGGLFGYDGHPIKVVNTRWTNVYAVTKYICFGPYKNRLTLSCDGSDGTNAYIQRLVNGVQG